MSTFKAFTTNTKTILSVDFDRFKTCPQICDYCYVGNIERFYPAYASKLMRNTKWAIDDPKDFAKNLNQEYAKARKSKSKVTHKLDKLPARIYGSGDFIPEHLAFMTELDFKFYIISKSLTSLELLGYIPVLTSIPNLTKIILSLDNQNLGNWHNIKEYYKLDKFGISYTGTVDDFNIVKAQGIQTTIFFNTGRKQVDRQRARKFREQCPCDTGLIKSEKACATCNKCWRSSVTKPKDWNVYLTQ